MAVQATLLTRDELRGLAEMREKPAVSIFLPTHRAGREIRQDPIRLKNQLREAEARITSNGVRAPEAKALLEPAARLIEDLDFWRHQDHGLALFAAPGFFRAYRVFDETEARTVVGDRFHLKPLISTLTENGRFYVLALSRGIAKLYEATRDRIVEVELPTTPKELEDAVGRDWEQGSLQARTTSDKNPGQAGFAAFHGHGNSGDRDIRDRELLSYLEKVDAGIRRDVTDFTPPVVIAAPEEVAAMFRQVTKYPNLIDEGVGGSPDRVPPPELHERAWKLIEPRLAAERDRIKARFRESVGTGKASDRIEDVVSAAHDGRIGEVLIAKNCERWGRFDPETRSVTLGGGREEGMDDLLDEIAVQTLLHSGSVHAVDASELPGSEPVAALFRY